MLRKIDAFGRPREDLRTKSALGGFITMVASSVAAILFLSHVYLYIAGSTKHSLSLAESRSFPVPSLDDIMLPPHISRDTGSRIHLKFHVTFPYLRCNQLDVAHDNASFASGELQKIHGKGSVTMRAPTYEELRPWSGTGAESDLACTIIGDLRIPKVGGSLSITLAKNAWAEITAFLVMGMFNHQNARGAQAKNKNHSHNVSHYIHSISFGQDFPLMKNPLEKVKYAIENDSGGLALTQLAVKLIPTKYKTFLGTSDMYQLSVTDHIVQPETLASQGSQFLPGMAISYDFTALAVNHIESRENILVFASSLISIVGGVFVTVSLLTGCLVHSAAAVAKKID